MEVGGREKEGGRRREAGRKARRKRGGRGFSASEDESYFPLPPPHQKFIHGFVAHANVLRMRMLSFVRALLMTFHLLQRIFKSSE